MWLITWSLVLINTANGFGLTLNNVNLCDYLDEDLSWLMLMNIHECG